MGLARCYRRFLEGFCCLTTPLSLLILKGVKFQWSNECEQNLTGLKKHLVSAPILNLPISGKGFTIYSDASKKVGMCPDEERQNDCLYLMTAEAFRENYPTMT